MKNFLKRLWTMVSSDCPVFMTEEKALMWIRKNASYMAFNPDIGYYDDAESMDRFNKKINDVNQDYVEYLVVIGGRRAVIGFNYIV